MRKTLTIILLLAACLFCACSAPRTAEPFDYPLGREQLEAVLAEYDWDWQLVPEAQQPAAMSQGQGEPPEGWESPRQASIFMMENSKLQQGFVNMHSYRDDPLPDGQPARYLNINISPLPASSRPRLAARIQAKEQPRMWLLAGRLLEREEEVAQIAQEVEALAARERQNQPALAGLESFTCYYRQGELACRSVYTSATGSERPLLGDLSLWLGGDLLTDQTRDLSALFPAYGWPRTVSSLQEMTAEPADGDKFLYIGSISQISSGETGLYQSLVNNGFALGQGWQGEFSEGQLSIGVLVLPTLLSEKELGQELLHLVSYWEQDGAGYFAVERSALPEARYRL